MQRQLSAKALVFTGILMTSVLSACAALDQMEADDFRRECQNLGIEPGSPHFDECMLQQQSLSEDESQHMLDRIERSEEYKHKH